MHLAEGATRIGHVHQAQGAQRQVEPAVLEGQFFGAHSLEDHVGAADLPGFPAGGGHHFLRDVRGGQGAFRADPSGEGKSDQPGAAGQFQHPLAGLGAGRVEQAALGFGQLTFP